jgi:hypothetical protein
MKPFRAILLIAIGCVSLLSACKEDEPDVEGGFDTGNLVIGDVTVAGLVYVDLTDSVIDPKPTEHQFKRFDVNQDGIHDLHIVSNNWTVITNEIKSLSTSLEISVETVPFVYYFYRETVNDSVEIVHSDNISTTAPPNSSVVNDAFVSPKVHNLYDTIDHNSLEWKFSGRLAYRAVWDIPKDTTAGSYTEYDLTVGKWNGVSGYVAFRFIKDRKVYYGWMKVEVIDYTKIVIYEYAYKRVEEI